MMSLDCARIIEALDRHKTIFDLERNDLGKRLCRIASIGSFNALTNGEDADGNRLADLSKAYEEWKAKKYPGRPLGILDFEMAKREHFLGNVVVTPNQATVTYGMNDQAKDEAEWFNEGDTKRNRPERRFWGLTKDAIDESNDLLDKHFTDSV